MRVNNIYSTYMNVIFTVHKRKQMILQYAYFQGLKRNDQEMTENEWENIVHGH
jgi:hypothetical protein